MPSRKSPAARSPGSSRGTPIPTVTERSPTTNALEVSHASWGMGSRGSGSRFKRSSEPVPASLTVLTNVMSKHPRSAQAGALSSPDEKCSARWLNDNLATPSTADALKDANSQTGQVSTVCKLNQHIDRLVEVSQNATGEAQQVQMPGQDLAVRERRRSREQMSLADGNGDGAKPSDPERPESSEPVANNIHRIVSAQPHNTFELATTAHEDGHNHCEPTPRPEAANSRPWVSYLLEGVHTVLGCHCALDCSR